ncbi:MAG TPA: PIN domain nuclease [Candidatus Binataceae bacterium]|nr:PIN domain nuclease [Candidatus Binataceae bacterium]
MIVVDSSVWINYFNGRATVETDALERLADTRLVIGDLIMAEVLHGFRTETEFNRAQQIFAALEYRPMVGREIAIAAARNHRRLRALGVTVRATIDTLIATFCIIEGHELLHCDRAFDPFERHLGLRVVRAWPARVGRLSSPTRPL